MPDPRLNLDKPIVTTPPNNGAPDVTIPAKPGAPSTPPAPPTPDLPGDNSGTIGDGGSNTQPAPGDNDGSSPIDTIGGDNPVVRPPNPDRLVNGPHEVPEVWKVPDSVADLIGDPNDKLKLSVLKQHIDRHAPNSPFLNQPSDAFKSVLVLNTAKLLEAAGAPLPTLAAKLDTNIPLDVSNVQVKLPDGSMGVRAATYGDDWKELISIVKSDPNALFMKITMHREDGHKFGGPDAVCADHAFEFTATHEGWFDVVQDENGKDVLLRGDYPTDYGAPPSGTSYYTFRMSAIKPEAMTFSKPVPDGAIEEAVAFTRTLGALSMGKVPFSSGDRDSWDRSYSVNDLEIDRGSLVQPAVNILGLKLDDRTMHNGELVEVKDYINHRSKYCAEGAHDRPAFLLHAKPTEGLREMKKIFDAAVEAHGGPHPDNRVGWKALQAAGYIDNYDDLETIGAAYTPFSIPGDDYKPLIEYGPAEAIKSEGSGNGLLSQPLNIAGLAMGAIGTLLPRDKMAATVAAGFAKAFAAAGDAEKPQMLGEAKAFVEGAVQQARQAAGALGVPPEQFAPMPALGTALEVGEALGLVLASGIQKGTLESDQLSKQIRSQARYEYMDDASKTRFDALFSKFAAYVASPTTNGKDLQGILEKFRTDVRNEEKFTFNYPDGSTVEDELLDYLPPHHYAIALSGFAVANAQQYVADFFPDGYAT